MSRIKNTTKNMAWSTISSIVTALLGFISRTVFISILGTKYLGVNGLFTNVLSMLSLTELGIGVAINFSLYKPLAENDTEKIKALMHFYKKAYQIIAIIVACLGLILVPFLSKIIKGGEGIEHITFLYLIFLFNTVYSYLFSYKRTLLSADQKSYLMTNVDMIISIFTLVIQIIVLIILKNYFVYLISASIIGVVQNLYVNRYINARYKYLLNKDYKKLTKNDKEPIIKNIKAMMFHKIGDLSVNQTDNIVISAFININTVGLVSNYTLVINTVNTFISNIFNSATASLGNLIATENEKKRLEVFNGYNFLSFCFFGWATACFYILLNPFIYLWLGSEKTIGQNIVILIAINFFLVGMRVPLGNIKAAAGVYDQDKFVPIVQAIVNLVISIIGAKYYGLAGVYIGTIISSILPCVYRPIVVYKYVFASSVNNYFKKYIKYTLVLIFNIFLLNKISNLIINGKVTYISFAIMSIVCLFIPNFIVAIIYHKSEDYRYIKSVLISMVRKVIKK